MDKKDIEIKALYEKYSCSDKYSCSVEATMDIIGGKWKGVIIYYLMSGVKRHSELKKLMGNVTQRMLTLQLRELEMDGLVHREVYKQIPPKVEYSLTELGKSLGSVILYMREWGLSNIHKILQNRMKKEKI
ncbi:transcriptional regulator [Paenibacillus polymyxa]|uniref:winged helix-turn-helix transcriptional regulator n=1 Tax=Paenibacillus TaxID=44249 RepID=UPI0008FC91EB|nr:MULTISPECIES: helix-turn-helix domain-containing protein [Paenibacillus]APB70973.1 transcriptional regulator [Paenibacillus polymyxa]QYK62522.1 HxlR-like helix-turn-helix [Paenibacillus sp. S25]